MSEVALLKLSDEYMTLLDARVVSHVQEVNWTPREGQLVGRKVVYAFGYVNGRIGAAHIRGTMGLHRFLLLLSNPGLLHPRHPRWAADHRNGDGLDNRLGNLRVVSAAENARNRHHASAPLAIGFYPPLTPIVSQTPQDRASKVRPRTFMPLHPEAAPCP